MASSAVTAFAFDQLSMAFCCSSVLLLVCCKRQVYLCKRQDYPRLLVSNHYLIFQDQTEVGQLELFTLGGEVLR